MKVNFNKPFLQVDDKPMEGANMADLLVLILSNDQESKGTTVSKFWDWCKDLKKKDGIIDVDKTDQELLVSFLESNTKISNMYKAQLISNIKETKELIKK